MRSAPAQSRGQQLRRQDDALLRLVAAGRSVEAFALARTLTQTAPQHGVGWKIFGGLLWQAGRADEAVRAMQASARLLPCDAEAHCNLGIVLATRHRHEEAATHFERTLEIDPEYAAAHFRMGMEYERQGRYAEAEARLRTALSLGARFLGVEPERAFSNLLYLMDYNSDVDAASLFAEHRRFGERFETPLRAAWPRHRNPPDPERRLHVGFVSGDFRDHAVATFFEPVLAQLTHSCAVRLHAYYSRDIVDPVTARLRTMFHHWNCVTRISDADLAGRIVHDDIDILVDLSGHTAENRLPTFARKPAPIQASWLGYPGTTGLQAVDYYLADDAWLPAGQFDRWFTEKIVHLPDRWAFEPHPDAPAVNPLPILETGQLTFGSFHRLGKINDATIRMWSALLLALPHSHLLLAGIPMDGREQRLLDRFAAHSVPAHRLHCSGRSSMAVYLALHHRVDLALDTFPYTGGTTTMHSLSMGVPTLTVAGPTASARAGAGILLNAGLGGFIAHDGAEFVEKGVFWANHPADLAAVRTTLRGSLAAAPGGNARLMAAHFEGALRHMWRLWCAGRPPEPFQSASIVSCRMPAA